MSKVTKPVVLDETAKQVVAQMQLQNEILTSLASGINYKPTSIKDVLNVVRAGQASKVFQVGDQIIVPWTDIATRQKYDVPLDIVAFGTSALQDGEELPSMTVQWHYATPFGVQFNQYQAFFYATEGLAAGTYYIEIGTTWGDKGYCVAGKKYQFTLTKPVPAGGQLAGFRGAPDQARRILRRLVRKAKQGELTKAKVDECYYAWRNHASKGNSFKLLQRMDKYYKSLWR